MNMNFNQLSLMQKLKNELNAFRLNHPKFPLFLKAVSQDALTEGTVIEISVTTPEGKNYCSNIKLKAEDMEFINSLKTINTL